MTIHCLHPLPTTASPRLARLKDDEDGLKLTVNLMRVVVDEDEDEISTLVVDTILPGPIEGSNAPQAGQSPETTGRGKLSIPQSKTRSRQQSSWPANGKGSVSYGCLKRKSNP
jgi:hypothetical protein